MCRRTCRRYILSSRLIDEDWKSYYRYRQCWFEGVSANKNCFPIWLKWSDAVSHVCVPTPVYRQRISNWLNQIFLGWIKPIFLSWIKPIFLGSTRFSWVQSARFSCADSPDFQGLNLAEFFCLEWTRFSWVEWTRFPWVESTLFSL